MILVANVNSDQCRSTGTDSIQYCKIVFEDRNTTAGWPNRETPVHKHCLLGIVIGKTVIELHLSTKNREVILTASKLQIVSCTIFQVMRVSGLGVTWEKHIVQSTVFGVCSSAVTDIYWIFKNTYWMNVLTNIVRSTRYQPLTYVWKQYALKGV